MLKRMYIVISLLSIATIMHGMGEEVGKRSAGGVLNDTLDSVVGKEIVGTITTLEHEFGGAIQEIKQEATLLGVTPKGAYEGAVVFGALYLTAETAKYFYHRYLAPEQEQALDAATLAGTQSVATAHSNVHVLGQFVSTTQVQAIVEAKWKELMGQGNLADKGYVDIATSQVKNMITSALETNASRVTVLRDVQGLKVAINGDSASKTIGIRTAHGLLVNRIAALENQKQAASSASSSSSSSSSAAAPSTEQGGGLFGGVGKMFGGRKKQKRDDSGVHGFKHKHGDDDDDDDDDAAPTDLHAAGDGHKGKQKDKDDTL